MRTFLLWKSASARSPAAVATELARLLRPLLAVPPRVHAFATDVGSLVFLEQPVRGWTASLVERDGDGWAVAAEYPFGAALRGGSERRSLLALCRALEDDPLALLEQLAPPFALIWAGDDGVIRVRNDGLGQAQLFEYDDGRVWALTNRITALAALGIRPVPDPADWAVRATLGWFPLRLTGYRNVRFVGPGTSLRLLADVVDRRTDDVLGGWVNPDPLADEDCLELARASLIRLIDEATPLWEKPSVGLSGGWDTRAVVSSLRAAGVAFSARVRGRPERPDVLIAQELARRAGFGLRIRTEAGLPPDDPESCRRAILLGLLWQAGYMVSSKHKSFLARKEGFDGGVVNVMGQHGEIGRGYYASRIRASEREEGEHEEVLRASLLAKMPPFLRPELREHVAEVVTAAYREAEDRGVTGRRRLDFFYLFERTRRWASASLNSQDGLVFAPFLNPDYIRAAFAYSGSMERSPFHRHIVARNAPEWTGVPVAGELTAPRAAGSTGDWRRPRGNRHYDSALYWRSVAVSLIEKALADRGWWTEVFDPTLASRTWHEAPDELAIAYLLPLALDGDPSDPISLSGAAVAERAPI